MPSLSYANALPQDIICPPIRVDETAKVRHVYDGDTLQLQDGRRIRLIGIDTPEIHNRSDSTVNSDTSVKRHGIAAKTLLSQLVNDGKGQVMLTYGLERYDRYKRTLAHVYTAKGQSIQAVLIAEGYAIAFTTPPNDRMSDCYRQQEAKAIQAVRGIWALPEYQLKTVGQLVTDTRGFRRLKGRVTGLWENKKAKGFWIDQRVMVRLDQKDLHNFNQYMLKNLKGHDVVVRGWIRPYRIKRQKNHLSNEQHRHFESHNQFQMSLRHEDSITLLK